MTEILPIKIDFKNLRIERQKLNNIKVYESIIIDNKIEFYKNINKKELERTLDELNIDFETLWNKCKNDKIFTKLLSKNLAINASRQGINDEKQQLDICNLTSSKCGIYIKNISHIGLRPVKNENRIITKTQMKKENIEIDKCLKSFDAQITGKCNGYISAKVSFGTGGHQDNVFEELDTIANWWCKYKHNDIILVLLFDTDLDNKFKILVEKYKYFDNIHIFNHYSFQEFIIKYSQIK